MDPAADRSDPPGSACLDVIGLKPTVAGTYVSLRCRSCEHEFDSYQPTVAGFPVGEHRCPQCAVTCVLSPEDLEAALALYVPSQGLDEMARLTQQATEIAETWHLPGTLARLLTYRGIRLGPATERGLLASITIGLMSALKAPKDGR